MIFNKSGHLRKMSVRIGDLNIKSCSEYAYLGTLLTPAGTSFKKAQNELVKKARKSMFGYLKEINIFQGAQPKTMLKLFNTLVTPILTYNSEIWGSLMKSNQLRNFDTFIKNLFDDKMPHEILQLKSGKIILGVHKKAANVAVRGELGSLPINIEIYFEMIKYYLHIVDLINNGNVLMEAALEECFKLCEENKTCWLTSVRYLLKFLGIDIAKNNYREQIYGKTIC